MVDRSFGWGLITDGFSANPLLLRGVQGAFGAESVGVVGLGVVARLLHAIVDFAGVDLALVVWEWLPNAHDCLLFWREGQCWDDE